MFCIPYKVSPLCKDEILVSFFLLLSLSSRKISPSVSLFINISLLCSVLLSSSTYIRFPTTTFIFQSQKEKIKMLATISLLSLLASYAAAQTTTTSIFFGGLADNSDPDDTFFSTVVASVVSADATATVLAVNCASSSNDTNNADECGGPDVTITANPTLFVIQSTIFASSETPSATGALTMSTRCELQGTTTGTCTWYEGGDAEAFGDDQSDLMTAPLTQELSATDISFTPITITAGVEKLAAASGSSTSSGSSSASSTAAPGSTGASSSGASATKGSDPSVTATASKSGSATAASQTGNSATSMGVSSGLLISVAALFAFFA
ncbi:hypothetical protein EV356DRAFT_178086 [Viridothelium virens]|uniref:Uncharacterized protein n=1 Tax=Viridothelium virens TaxID=1048519 RepID=A0A6A6H985_VIRVR|nr:hypothetical protein EV356DRAFT_178086 [Viridothelium virens]